MSKQNDETRRQTEARLQRQRLDAHQQAAKGSAALKLFYALRRATNGKAE